MGVDVEWIALLALGIALGVLSDTATTRQRVEALKAQNAQARADFEARFGRKAPF